MSLRFNPKLKKIPEERKKELDTIGLGLKLGEPPQLPEGKALFRGDGRTPFQVFPGLTAKGNNMNLHDHVFPPDKDIHYSSQESAYISASTSKEVAVTFPKNLRPGTQETYVYEIHAKQPVIDVASELMSHPKIKSDPLALDLLQYEKEMAIPFRVHTSEIKGGWRVDVRKEFLTMEELNSLYSKESTTLSVNQKPRVIQDEFIPNPRYPANIVSKFWTVAKGAGRITTGIGLYLDATNLHAEYQASRETGDYSNTYKETTRIAGSWSGAYTAGILGVKTGVSVCAPFGLYASAACGLIGGLVSSVVGYQAGGKFSTYIFDEGKKCSAQFNIQTESLESKSLILKNYKVFLTPIKTAKDSKMFSFTDSETEIKKQQRQSEEYHQRLRDSEESSAAHFRETVLLRSAPLEEKTAPSNGRPKRIKTSTLNKEKKNKCILCT